MGKKNDRFIIILDIDKVFTSYELSQVADKDGAEDRFEEQGQRA
jgi:hypothetical protein